MKKIILLLLLFVYVCSYSQEKLKAYIQKTEVISFDQYDLIKKVNEFYSDIIVSKQIINNYVNDLKEQRYLDSELVYNLPSDCKAYQVKFINSSLLNYSYLLKDDTYISGDVRLFNGHYYRTMFMAKGNNRSSQYFIDGKLISDKTN